MRVVMLIQAYLPLPGGAERQIASLVPLLAERGIEVHVITRRWHADLPPRERLGGAEVYRLPMPGPKPLAALVYTLSALPLIRELAPDVLHAHELLSPTTTALAARQLFGLPVVAKVLRGGRLGDVYKLKRRPLGSLRLRTISRQVDRFIVISREVDSELSALGVPAARRVFIPNGVDTGRFSPPGGAEKAALRASIGLPGDRLVAIYSGRLVAEKQVDKLLDIWPAVRAGCPGALLLVVGSGPEERCLRAVAGEGVIFTGHLKDPSPYLRAADLFVLPSATEGLSNALLEGMAAGLPVVATAVGGSRDVLRDGQNGRLVEAGDLASLRAAITGMLGDPAERARLGQAGRQTVQESYALESTAGRLAALYQELCS